MSGCIYTKYLGRRENVLKAARERADRRKPTPITCGHLNIFPSISTIEQQENALRSLQQRVQYFWLTESAPSRPAKCVPNPTCFENTMISPYPPSL